MPHACHGFWNATKLSRFAHFWRCAPCHAKRHLNPQKCSEPHSFFHFWLRNVLRATTACTSSTSQLPKVVQTWCVLYILTSKCASRQNGVHIFDIATSKSAPNPSVSCTFDLEMCFSATTACNFSSLIWPAGSAPAALASLLFDLPEPQIIGKTQCFATFLPFRAPGSSFFRDFLFFDLLSSSLLFSGSSHLCSSSVHIVGSLTSKLPSTTTLHYTTLHYTNYTTLHYNCIYHYIAPHDTTLQLQLHDFTLQYIGNTTLYHATVQNTTVHYNTLH